MKLKRVLSLTMSVIVAASLFTGCAPKPAAAPAETAAPAEVKISMLNTKGEIQAQLEETAKLFTAENPGITVEITPAVAGQSPFEKVSAMYAAGNAPTLAMLDGGDIPKFGDKFADLSGEKWVADAATGTLDSVKTAEGKLLAFPATVEGYGFIYNQDVLDKAVGGTFDPTTIKTTADLEAVFKKIEAIGVAPLLIAPMDWSLGAHFLAIGYTTQANNGTDINAFLDGLKAGTTDLASNPQINGLLDTFDIMKKYNLDKADPLSVTYEKGPEVLGTEKVGMWFMGNWAWPQIKEFNTGSGNYAFLPVPISNNAADYGNEGIVAGPTKFIGLDTTQNTPEQQAAAKKFLEWLVYSETGQDALVNKCNVIPAFNNITLVPQDPLGVSIKSYLTSGKSLIFMNTLPSDHWSKTGASMQKYLSDNTDRKGLLTEITEYWKTVK